MEKGILMQYRNGKKSFLQNVVWVGVLLLVMGVLFGSVGIGVQLIPMSPENMTSYRNGVLQPSTEDTVRTFRLIFLLTFGFVGLVLAISGGIILWRAATQRKLARYLKEEGASVSAEIVELSFSFIRVNHRMLSYLRCSCIGPQGKTYIFKSGLLRMDPTPYLQDRVTVYYDRNDISRYFVDVDGSVGLGDTVIELS